MERNDRNGQNRAEASASHPFTGGLNNIFHIYYYYIYIYISYIYISYIYISISHIYIYLIYICIHVNSILYIMWSFMFTLR